MSLYIFVKGIIDFSIPCAYCPTYGQNAYPGVKSLPLGNMSMLKIVYL